MQQTLTPTSTFNRKEVYKAALSLAIPMTIQTGITNAVGLIDNVMVGSLGTEAITAVSIVVQLVFVYALLVFGGYSGPAIYGAQYYGSGDIEGVRNVFRLKWLIAFFCMIAGFIIFFIFGDGLISLYLQGETSGIDAALTLSLSKDYLNIMLLGLLPYTISSIYAGSLRETGDSFKPMIAGICSVVADIAFNYLLIFGNFGFPKLGVQGAALATVIGRLIEMVVIIAWAHAKKDKHTFLKGVYKTLLIPKRIAAIIIKKGMPIFINEFFYAISIAVLTQCYSLRGLNVVAGINISNAISNLLMVVFITLGSSTGILCGQMLGAGEYEKAKKSSVSLTMLAAGIAVMVGVVLILLSGVFPELYNTTADVKEYAKYFIIITAAFFPVHGIINCLYFTLRSGGRTFITFLFDAVFSWVVCTPIAYILCLATDINILAIYAIVLSADIIKIIIGAILIKKGVWITNLVDGL